VNYAEKCSDLECSRAAVHSYGNDNCKGTLRSGEPCTHPGKYGTSISIGSSMFPY